MNLFSITELILQKLILNDGFLALFWEFINTEQYYKETCLKIQIEYFILQGKVFSFDHGNIIF